MKHFKNYLIFNYKLFIINSKAVFLLTIIKCRREVPNFELSNLHDKNKMEKYKNITRMTQN